MNKPRLLVVCLTLVCLIPFASANPEYPYQELDKITFAESISIEYDDEIMNATFTVANSSIFSLNHNLTYEIGDFSDEGLSLTLLANFSFEEYVINEINGTADNSTIFNASLSKMIDAFGLEQAHQNFVLNGTNTSMQINDDFTYIAPLLVKNSNLSAIVEQTNHFDSYNMTITNTSISYETMDEIESNSTEYSFLSFTSYIANISISESVEYNESILQNFERTTRFLIQNATGDWVEFSVSYSLTLVEIDEFGIHGNDWSWEALTLLEKTLVIVLGCFVLMLIIGFVLQATEQGARMKGVYKRNA